MYQEGQLDLSRVTLTNVSFDVKDNVSFTVELALCQIDISKRVSFTKVSFTCNEVSLLPLESMKLVPKFISKVALVNFRAKRSKIQKLNELVNRII